LNWRIPLAEFVTNRIMERLDSRRSEVPKPDFRDALSIKVVRGIALTLTLEIPQDLAALLGAPDRDLSRTALEVPAVEEYRSHRLPAAQFRRLLDISRFEADRILKAHSVWLEYDLENFEREGEAVRLIQEHVSS
jgi:Uncharacterised protein family (UPF0175)